jgi:GTPase SAR1 family protein
LVDSRIKNYESVIGLIGNKNDLYSQRKVEKEEALEFAKKYGISFYMESSAKDLFNVSEMFHTIARMIMEERERF